jgi:osmoprotectant transport system permease protein
VTRTKRARTLIVAACAGIALAATSAHAASPPIVTVGSKAFPESWILGEALARLAHDPGGADARHRSNLGGTEIVFQALTSGEVDVYPDYTGTISEVILRGQSAQTLADMRRLLAPRGIGVSEPLGFNDGYALAIPARTADRLGVRTLSDLARHPELRLGLTHEFLGRADGWPGLARAYGLDPASPRGIQHELAYQAIASDRIDVTDIYTTDAQIAQLGLRVLDDDRGFFPRYDAVLLYRLDLERRAPAAFAAIMRIAGRVDEARMIRANARVVLGQRPFAEAAESLLVETLDRRGGTADAGATVWRRIARDTMQHLRLVLISLAAAIAVGIPLGVVAARAPGIASVAIGATGLLQTIPSLALLALLIPLLGIGAKPALVALFLYSLLPIVRNTCTGLATLPPPLLESARALGLSARARLLRIELPMASPAILAGIKTSAVINVGSATLAALVGAGGLGDPILTGIQLRQPALILQGAIPAALLALLVQWGFDRLDRWIVPRGLMLQSGGT